ncbi:MAG: ORF6N domain-containing protein, partial [Akkermansiaceae bacterium]
MPPTKKTAKKKSASKLTPAALIPEQLAPLVIRLRRENVILDSDIAELYGVETKRLNEAVKRNIERFPADFMFQLSPEEENLRSQIVTLKRGQSSLRSQSATSSSHGGRRTLPYAFTEQGVAMLSSVLRSPRAVEVNIAIMRTFVQLRSLM